MAHDHPQFADLIINKYLIEKFRLHEERINVIRSEYVPSWILYTKSLPFTNCFVEGFNETLWAFERFGHIFSSLHFTVDGFETIECQRFFKHVEKYTPQAVKSIVITGNEIEELANSSYIFDKTMKEVVLANADEGRASLSSIFPFLEELTIRSNNLSQSIGHHFPHLKKCLILSNNYPDVQSLYELEFVRLNPQLREFQTNLYNNASYVRYLNENLPNLESLNLDINVNSANATNFTNIHFKNVREFTLKLSGDLNQVVIRRNIGNISFDNLEVFNFQIGRSVYNEEFYDMIVENSGLKKIDTNMQIRSGHVLEIIEALPELKEVGIYWKNNISDTLETLLTLPPPHRLNQIQIHEYIGDLERFKIITESTWRTSIEIWDNEDSSDRIAVFSRM